jgi:hypothetical protein
LNGKSIHISETVSITVEKPTIRSVRNEKYCLPIFNEKSAGWLRGEVLKGLVTQECSATDLLIPGSVKVKPSPHAAIGFAENKDFRIDTQWATLGRLPASAIQENQTVYIDYDYSPCRLDSLTIDPQGRFQLVSGEPGVGCLSPPRIKKSEIVVANIWVPGRTQQITEENLFPLDFEEPPLTTNQGTANQAVISKTLNKLRQGKPLTILAWGDSVTNGGYLNNPASSCYQVQVVEILRKRFPRSDITLRTASWPGATSLMYLDAPAGGTYDFVRDCLDPKPDLVVIEFVNDACFLPPEDYQSIYTRIHEHFTQIGTEQIYLTPHFVRPDWMGMTTLKVEDDPRPYVSFLKEFTSQYRLGLADASKHWAGLWRKGIPYTTLLMNSINHPDERGHLIFTQALMELFPDADEGHFPCSLGFEFTEQPCT